MLILAQNLIHKIHQQTNTPTITEIMILMGTNTTEKAMVNAYFTSILNSHFEFYFYSSILLSNKFENSRLAPILFEHAAALDQLSSH